MPQTRKVCPEGCTLEYGSPQQLYARQLVMSAFTRSDSAPSDSGSTRCTAQEHEQSTGTPAKGKKFMQRLPALLKTALGRGKASGAADKTVCTYEEADLWLDGPIIDVFSAGVVLYEMVGPGAAVHQFKFHAWLLCFLSTLRGWLSLS